MDPRPETLYRRLRQAPIVRAVKDALRVGTGLQEIGMAGVTQSIRYMMGSRILVA
jgi:hypothetical protein